MIRMLVMLVATLCLLAQETPPAPVAHTEARSHRIQDELQLPGVVESNVTSLVATEVGGLVVDYPVREGDRVKAGQEVARLNARDRELDILAIKAEVREAAARQKLAQRNFERTEELFEAKVISQQQLDDTRYEYDAWQGRIDKLNADIERLRYDIERCVITAPFDGVVIRKHTEVGQWLGVGDPVLELLSPAQVEIVVNVPEQYFRTVRSGGSARIHFDAFPGQTKGGVIRAVIPKADEKARTFPVRVRATSGVNGIGVGMLARVSLEGVTSSGRRAKTVTIVPKDAIHRQGSQLMVFLLEGDDTVKPVPVQTGSADGVWVEVLGGVEPGQRVITRGNERLQPGQKVRSEPAEYALP